MFKRVGFCFLVLLFSFSLHAHPGHEHGPEMDLSPNGGIIEESASYHVELVHKGSDIILYFYDVEMKPVKEAKELFVKGYSQLPRKEKKELEFKTMGDHMHAKFDSKGAHRFDIYVEVKDDEKNELKWTLH